MEMINERKLSGDKDGRRDLLSNLVNANEAFLENGEQGLSEDEIFGMEPGLHLREYLFKRLPFRKHVHVLLCRTRGNDHLLNAGGGLIPVR